MTEIAILGLATHFWSITSTTLSGPFGLAKFAREAILRWRGFSPVENDDGEVFWMRGAEGVDSDWIADGVTCPLCASLWWGIIMTALMASGDNGEIAVVISAVAGLSVLPTRR